MVEGADPKKKKKDHLRHRKQKVTTAITTTAAATASNGSRSDDALLDHDDVTQKENNARGTKDDPSSSSSRNNNDLPHQQQLQQRQQDSAESSGSGSSSSSSSCHVTVLQERSIWSRWDVTPFAILYLFLISWDDAGCWYKTAYFVVAFLSHLSLILLCQWSMTIRVGVAYRRVVVHVNMENGSTTRKSQRQEKEEDYHRWTHAYICTPESAAGIVPIRIITSSNSTTSSSSRNVVVATIEFQDCVYRYCSDPPDWDVRLWTTTTKDGGEGNGPKQQQDSKTSCISFFRPVRHPHDLPLSFYQQGRWHGHASIQSCNIAHALYGPNTTILHLPTFVHLLSEQVTAPFFVFQLFCVLLWSLDEYWIYALFTLGALLLFECTVAYHRRVSLRRINDMTSGGRAGGHHHDYITVVRMKKECRIRIEELLPGDYIVRLRPGQTVPADLVLIRGGTAVCDEALLTGESIPQRKHPLDDQQIIKSDNIIDVMNDNNNGEKREQREEEQRLDLTAHKESILFAGTVLVAADDDLAAIVLRTGFATAQGSLLRTMAHATKTSDAVHTRDTFLFILLLVLCALAAAAYVLYHGWHDDRRNRFRLILHVIMLVTSVVPPELPLELSLAITNSVASLMHRCQVYCTEHHRVAWAGEVTTCCFDKTGTLTSDTMLVKGVRLFGPNDDTYATTNNTATTTTSTAAAVATSAAEEDDAALVMDNAAVPWETVRVMVACQSLATTGHTTVGDPLERAVLEHAGYRLYSNDSVGPNAPPTKSVENNDSNNKQQKAMMIHHRFAFSSKLKRMTVLASELNDTRVWVLAKGAPETIKDRLAPHSVPPNYDAVASHHMGRGRRVLAMAYKDAGHVHSLRFTVDQGRDALEYNLLFAGFLVLECPLKAHTASIISDLQVGGHAVVMITGDALLTAVEVARQVGIVPSSSSSDPRRKLPLPRSVVYRIIQRSTTAKYHDENGQDNDDPLSHFECLPITTAAGENVTSLPLSNVQKLSEMKQSGKVAFCISGETLGELAALASAPLSTRRRTGASSSISSSPSLVDEKTLLLSEEPQRALARMVRLVSVFARHTPHQKEAVIAALNLSGEQTMMAGDGTNDVGALKRAHVGISIISAPDIEAKQRNANKKLAKAKSRKKATTPGQKATIQESIRQLQEAQDDLAQVELGDASVAAPFTSRALNIRCCKDVIQQGRCTLVTMLQIYKVLGINCLVNALVLSKLFLHGAKQGDRQLTVLGMAVAALFYFVTRAEPLSTLSPIRPPASVLCGQVLISIAGQFLVHSVIILVATQTALSFVDPYDPSLVPDGPFNSNALNTCTFLSTCLTTVNTFAVNYRGRPFMKDLKENKLFYRSLLVCYAVIAICTLEIFPPLNELLQLAPLPSITAAATFDNTIPMVAQQLLSTITFSGFLAALMVGDTLLVFAFERTIRRTFEQRSD